MVAKAKAELQRVCRAESSSLFLRTLLRVGVLSVCIAMRLPCMSRAVLQPVTDLHWDPGVWRPVP